MSELKDKAKKLGLKTIVSNWGRYEKQDWLESLLLAEEQERDQSSLERRIQEAHLGQFKPMSEFDWDWPKEIDREHVEELFTLDFLKEQANVVLVSNNGLGKTMIAQNLAYRALLNGKSTKFVKASQMLNELIECDGSISRRRRLQKYCRPKLLVIDEVGYMSYDNRCADLLYEVISGRYQNSSTIVTTNTSFKQWGELFPNAACVVTLVDRLLHKAEKVQIEGESYRVKEAAERAAAKEKGRQEKRKPKKKKGDQDA
jgi:DNA replication protein DnaC